MMKIIIITTGVYTKERPQWLMDADYKFRIKQQSELEQTLRDGYHIAHTCPLVSDGITMLIYTLLKVPMCGDGQCTCR